ncbi:hypothetical protein KEM56_001008 [Ascosphaera pollenicola]|nr:hypothetical protein KEM56_001008 [Ascosphaera pollenicola]
MTADAPGRESLLGSVVSSGWLNRGKACPVLPVVRSPYPDARLGTYLEDRDPVKLKSKGSVEAGNMKKQNQTQQTGSGVIIANELHKKCPHPSHLQDSRANEEEEEEHELSSSASIVMTGDSLIGLPPLDWMPCPESDDDDDEDDDSDDSIDSLTSTSVSASPSPSPSRKRKRSARTEQLPDVTRLVEKRDEAIAATTIEVAKTVQASATREIAEQARQRHQAEQRHQARQRHRARQRHQAMMEQLDSSKAELDEKLRSQEERHKRRRAMFEKGIGQARSSRS